MPRFLIWGAFTVAVTAFCVWRPQAARTFVGLFFGVIGLGIHGALIATNPQRYVDFAAQDFPTDVWTMLRRHRRPGSGVVRPGDPILAAGPAFLCTQGRTSRSSG